MKPENKTQQEIFIYCHNAYPDYIIHSVPNGFGVTIPGNIPARFHAAIRKAIAMAVELCKLTGMLPGVADMILHLPNGKCVMIEVKTEDGTQQDKQKKIQKKMEAMNSNYILVRSLDDFKKQITQFL